MLGFLCVACQRRTTVAPVAPPTAAPQMFEEFSTRLGVSFVHDAGSPGRYFMPEIMGSGCALFDYDNDGRLDIYLIHNGGPNGKRNQLFHQEVDGTFRDASAGSGLDVTGNGMGVAIGDVNNDGFPDLLLTEYGRIRLFLNNGNGTFRDATAESGLDDPGWATSAAFVDFDRDGFLDLAVTNYVAYSRGRWCAASDGRQDYCNPNAFDGAVSRLYRNRGRPVLDTNVSATRAAPGVRFDDVTATSGLSSIPSAGLGVFCGDFDGDGWPDLFIANDGRRNFLWINHHDGTFVEEGLQRGIALNTMGTPEGNMGIAIGDIDGDGLLDLFVTHLYSERHTLWLQGPRGVFQDRTAARGLTSARWRGTGFGAVMADFDLDGALDLAIVNGGVKRGPIPPRGDSPRAFAVFWDRYAQRNQLFHNDGHAGMVDVSEENPAFCRTPAVGRGLAVGDFDNDGRPDLLVTSIGAPARLYRNIVAHPGHWLIVRAVDPTLGGRDAYGAQITVEAAGRQHVGWVNPGFSYLCSNDPRAHFGLGTANRIETMRVQWPDGATESFDEHAVDRILTLRKGSGSATRK